MQFNSAAQAPTGWTPGGNLTGAALFLQDNGFGGNGTTGASIAQSFDTLAGLPYTVSFFTSAQPLGNGPQSYKAGVFTGNGLHLLASFTHGIPVANNGANQTFSFVAAGTTSVLRFTDTSDGAAAASLNGGLDHVSVTAVPEPGTWALWLLGAGDLAQRLRRARRR